MKRKMKLLSIIAITAVIWLTFWSCLDLENDTDPLLQPRAALNAVPVAASNDPAKPVVLDYFKFEDRHWYIIDAGYIRNAFIAQLGQAHFDGRTPVTLTVSEATETNITTSLTSTVSNSIEFSDTEQVTRGLSEEVSRAVTAGITVGNTVGAEGGFWGVKASVETSLEASLEATHGMSVRDSEEISNGFTLSQGRTTETSMNSIRSFTRTQAQQVSYDIGRNNEPSGWYRYALYAVSDVFFIISTSTDNQRWLSWDIVSAVRPEYTPHFEYSSTGKFDNAPIDNLITFSDGFYKTLPKPVGHRLTTNVNVIAGGFVQYNPHRQSYQSGDLVEVFAVTNPGYKFINWTGTGAPTGTEANNTRIIITINNDLTLTANFQIMHTITAKANFENRGTISRNPNLESYAPGTQVTVTAAAKAGFRFENWEGLPTGVDPSNASITFAISDSLELTANFRNEDPKKSERSFGTPGQSSWTMPINITYPATIEVYVLGAGGGGQGGFYSWRAFGSNRRGTGGAGGGGAASYVKFETNQRLTFNVTVGSGGEGGKPRDSDLSSWSAGYPGKAGGNSTVIWGSNTLTARGGNGGGSSSDTRDLSGGTGGAANTTWPAGNQARISSAGVRGSNGDDWNDVSSTGGNAGTITTSSLTFGGGGGAVRQGGVWARPVNGGTGGGGSSAYGGEGSNNHGGTGGNGRVHIIVNWNE